MSPTPTASERALPFATAARLDAIEPFHVMQLVKQAREREAQGHPVLHLSIGEPDFQAPPAVTAALVDSLNRGESGYTPALGLLELRQAIARHYELSQGLEVDPQRIVVTAGASGALLLACLALLEPGTELLMPDPAYPCNRHIASAAGASSRLLPCGPEQSFQPTAADIEQAWQTHTRALLLASPGNPTGTCIQADTLAGIVDVVRRRGGALIVDEIYQALSFDRAPRSALALGEDIIVINSFSKYFCMTGWRLGWLVLPPALVADVEKLAQNLFICPSTLAQRAALACFEPEQITIYESRRDAFRARRDHLVPALRELGFRVPTAPDGAFYVWADIRHTGLSSDDFCQRMLMDANVCIVPGADFSVHEPQHWVRISYATSMEQLYEALARMRPVMQSLGVLSA
jgi:aspartate/methionine/tyrosine aminotransferase